MPHEHADRVVGALLQLEQDFASNSAEVLEEPIQFLDQLGNIVLEMSELIEEIGYERFGVKREFFRELYKLLTEFDMSEIRSAIRRYRSLNKFIDVEGLPAFDLETFVAGVLHYLHSLAEKLIAHYSLDSSDEEGSRLYERVIVAVRTGAMDGYNSVLQWIPIDRRGQFPLNEVQVSEEVGGAEIFIPIDSIEISILGQKIELGRHEVHISISEEDGEYTVKVIHSFPYENVNRALMEELSEFEAIDLTPDKVVLLKERLSQDEAIRAVRSAVEAVMRSFGAWFRLALRDAFESLDLEELAPTLQEYIDWDMDSGEVSVGSSEFRRLMEQFTELYGQYMRAQAEGESTEEIEQEIEELRVEIARVIPVVV